MQKAAECEIQVVQFNCNQADSSCSSSVKWAKCQLGDAKFANRIASEELEATRAMKKEFNSGQDYKKANSVINKQKKKRQDSQFGWDYCLANENGGSQQFTMGYTPIYDYENERVRKEDTTLENNFPEFLDKFAAGQGGTTAPVRRRKGQKKAQTKAARRLQKKVPIKVHKKVPSRVIKKAL